jgi:hypothetical protein
MANADAPIDKLFTLRIGYTPFGETRRQTQIPEIRAADPCRCLRNGKKISVSGFMPPAERKHERTDITRYETACRSKDRIFMLDRSENLPNRPNFFLGYRIGLSGASLRGDSRQGTCVCAIFLQTLR